MLLLLDNYDSFTYNVYQLLAELGAEVEVIRHDQTTVPEIEAKQYAGIVISPGPGVPKDAGISEDVIRELGGKVPILGICLGHQAIGEVFGAKRMLDEGVFADAMPDAILGLHVWAGLHTGQIGFRSGPSLASADDWALTITGRQTHGSRPWDGVDPITVGAQILLAASLAAVSPLALAGSVQYCWLLAVSALVFMLWPSRGTVPAAE